VIKTREKTHKMVTKNKNHIGKAYGFFDCNATKEEIEREIPFIRDAVDTPNQLELILTEDINSLSVDPDLFPIAQVLDAKYVIETTCQDYTNEKTADELSAVLNQAYQSSLYQEGERFRGEIVYKNKKSGEYVFRE